MNWDVCLQTAKAWQLWHQDWEVVRSQESGVYEWARDSHDKQLMSAYFMYYYALLAKLNWKPKFWTCQTWCGAMTNRNTWFFIITRCAKLGPTRGDIKQTARIRKVSSCSRHAVCAKRRIQILYLVIYVVIVRSDPHEGSDYKNILLPPWRLKQENYVDGHWHQRWIMCLPFLRL